MKNYRSFTNNRELEQNENAKSNVMKSSTIDAKPKENTNEREGTENQSVNSNKNNQINNINVIKKREFSPKQRIEIRKNMLIENSINIKKSELPQLNIISSNRKIEQKLNPIQRNRAIVNRNNQHLNDLYKIYAPYLNNPALKQVRRYNNNNFTTVLGLMLSNGLVALSSALLSQYQGFADVSMGRGAIVIGLAAVIIGDVIFGKVFTNFALKLLSVVIGSVIYYAVYSLVIWLGMSGDDMKLITSLIVALFLSIPYWKGKYFSKPAKKGGAANA